MLCDRYRIGVCDAIIPLIFSLNPGPEVMRDKSGICMKYSVKLKYNHQNQKKSIVIDLDLAAISGTLNGDLQPLRTSLYPHLHGALISSLSVHHSINFRLFWGWL